MCFELDFASRGGQVEREEEMGMAPDKYREVFDLAQRGARAFRERRYDEVVRWLAKLPLALSLRRLGLVWDWE
jgi:hypothetical protein